MNKKIQNQNAVNPLGNKEVQTAQNTKFIAKADWAKVFILFILLGFWGVSKSQTVFNNPVEFNDLAEFNDELHITPMVSPAGRIFYLYIDDNGEVIRSESLEEIPGGIKFTDVTNPFGAEFGYVSGGNILEVNQRENAIMQFNVDGTTALELTPTGGVRMNNIQPIAGLTNFLVIDGGSNVLNQSGSLPQVGGAPGEILYWDGGQWTPAPSPLVHVDPVGIGFVGVGTMGPLLPAMPLTSGGPAGGGAWITTPPPFPPASPRFSVNGDISTNGNYFGNNIYIVSDERLKQNISKLPEWKRIFEIQPYTYKYIDQKHEGYSFGFMAQDVYKTLPELTSGWGEALTVNYIGFIPFLSQGLQEHEDRLNAIENTKHAILETEKEISRINAEIEALENQNIQFVQRFEELEAENIVLQNQNQQLENRLTALEEKFNAICNMPCIQNNQSPKVNGEGTKNGFGQTGTLGQPPVLEQNEPNPFSETTVIRYFLPEGSSNAKIEVRNAEGKVVGSFPISQSGHGNITLASGTLSAGNYYYTLVINNNIVDTKKMVLLN